MSVPFPLSLEIYNVENQKIILYFIPSIDIINYYLFSGIQYEDWAMQYSGDYHGKIQAGTMKWVPILIHGTLFKYFRKIYF